MNLGSYMQTLEMPMNDDPTGISAWSATIRTLYV